MKAIEIEIDGPHNETLNFRPLQRSIRGRFDMMRIGEPMSKVKATEWPVVPSQRLGIDPDGTGYLIEPLHDEEHAAIKEKITATGKGLEPRFQEFDNISVPTWLTYFKLAIDAGLARVVSGEMPASIEGKVKRNYIMADAEPTSSDKMTAAIEAQTKAFTNLTEAILQLVEK